MATIIDSLVVLLGLDAESYKRQKKEVEQVDATGDAKRDKVNKQNDKAAQERARKEKQFAAQRKKDTDSNIDGLVTLGKTLSGVFLGFETIKGGAEWLANLNASQAGLGRFATRTGVDVASLNAYGNAVELAGGKAEDAAATFANLAQQFSQFKITGGTPGPLLQLLTQKGVAFRDAKGNLLDIGTILDELSRKTANMTNQDRATLFAQAGISEGVINRMLESSKLQDEQLAKARAFNGVTDQSVKNAEDLKEAFTGVRQELTKMGQTALGTVSPALTELLHGDVKDAAADTAVISAKGALSLAQFVQNALASADKASQQIGVDLVTALTGSAPTGTTRAERNHNPGNLRPYKQGQATDKDGYRVFSNDLEGESALQSDIEAKMKRGLDTIASLIPVYAPAGDHNNVAAYVATLSKSLGKGANEKLTRADLPMLIRGIARVEAGKETNVTKALALTTPAITASAKPGAGAAGAAGNTNVTVGKIEVHSSNADPTAVANAAADALNRKITVAQVGGGQS